MIVNKNSKLMMIIISGYTKIGNLNLNLLSEVVTVPKVFNSQVLEGNPLMLKKLKTKTRRPDLKKKNYISFNTIG